MRGEEPLRCKESMRGQKPVQSMCRKEPVQPLRGEKPV